MPKKILIADSDRDMIKRLGTLQERAGIPNLYFLQKPFENALLLKAVDRLLHVRAPEEVKALPVEESAEEGGTVAVLGVDDFLFHSQQARKKAA